MYRLSTTISRIDPAMRKNVICVQVMVVRVRGECGVYGEQEYASALASGNMGRGCANSPVQLPGLIEVVADRLDVGFDFLVHAIVGVDDNAMVHTGHSPTAW